ncbi:hypothetical protein [Candidatus Arthromitus sp. SFB-turkey]|uniref:hypothetical protein n=1 Tax=Candidatus Arthromitus sp. SFB-turkey TaxID=1840217 RepID=UPI0007F361F3|nr:hypothetical protein [Candidatus Arthromitus sp. SFB-turkey]OAT87421.1 hypothetical protein A6P36_02645 [Candidatus Arthromitus sp. SFB-turkey]
MLGKKIKKLIGVATLALMLGLGVSSTVGQVAKAESFSFGVSDVFDSVEALDEQFGYGPYEAYVNTVGELQKLIDDGFLPEEEGKLQIKFLEAKTEDEKEAVYREIIDYLYREGILTSKEADRLKSGSYKDYWRTLDEMFYDEMVDLGYMTKEEADLQVRFNGAVDSKERQAVYEEMVDLRVKEGKVTEEQARKLKSDGYDKDFDNMDDIYYQNKVNELFDLGVISQDERDRLIAKTDEGRWDDVNRISDIYFINQEVENGNLSQEEADLYLKYLNATDDGEKQRLYGQIAEKMYERGEISEDELKEIKELI